MSELAEHQVLLPTRKETAMFLVLSRGKNESIVINNEFTVTVVEIREDKVRLGVISPKDVPVHRQEVFEAIHGKAAAVLSSPTTPEPKKKDQEPYQHFTERVRKVMQLANQEAQRLQHEYIGTEHILLGLVKEGAGVAAHVLRNLEIDLQHVRQEVEKIVQAGPDMVTMGKLAQTPRAKKVIEFAIEEARNLNQNYVGTEHILLGLVRENAGVAAQVLMNLGLSPEITRQEVLNLLGYPRVGSEEPIPVADKESQHLPDDIRAIVGTFDLLTEQLQELIEEAVAGMDFEKAAGIRDHRDEIQKLRAGFVRLWP
jgi:carbon storage regulator CsrA